MTQQDIFSLLLTILLLSSRQLDNNDEIDFSDLNNIIIITLLFRLLGNGNGTGNCSCHNTNSSF